VDLRVWLYVQRFLYLNEIFVINIVALFS